MAATLALSVLAIPAVSAFPWVAQQAGVRSDLLAARNPLPLARRAASCPNNPDHNGAVPINDKYPYLGAINGKQGTGKGGILVPAPGDVDHYFHAPGPLDIRGPCPGLNTAANHGFLSRDGITTYNELVDAQQNVYNVGYDLANLLAVAGVGLDGDFATGKLSIGCDATERTASGGGLLGDELGLNGHNKFEGDASLTRNDYFTANGDDYKFNSTLFASMLGTCKGNCDLNNLALYRYNRYQESVHTNPDFFFGPGSLLLYGAASFLYELFPDYGPEGSPDEKTMMSFFGANKTSNGTYQFNNAERLPENWHNRREPLSDGATGEQIFKMYFAYPVAFGGNIGVNNFNGMNYSNYVQNGKLNAPDVKSMTCLLYQLSAYGFPTAIDAGQVLGAKALEWTLGKLAPSMAALGCPRNPSIGF